MGLFNASDLRAGYFAKTKSIVESREFTLSEEYSSGRRQARVKLEEISRGFSKYKTYDVFLSHSKRDEIVILQLYNQLQNLGLTVYVDWINDPLLNRSEVTPATANLLRERIQTSKSLFLAHSSNSSMSSWVQWELGYGDGVKGGKVAILPIEEEYATSNFHRQEYLGLYPYIDITGSTLYVHGSSANYKRIADWFSMSNPRDLLFS